MTDLAMAVYLACLLQHDDFNPYLYGTTLPSPNWDIAAWLFECVLNELTDSTSGSQVE